MAKTPIQLDWTKHLSSPKDKEDFENSLRNSTYITARLRDILLERLEEIYKNETKLDDFTNTDWAYKQAFRNGRKQAIKQTLDLLGFIE